MLSCSEEAGYGRAMVERQQNVHVVEYLVCKGKSSCLFQPGSRRWKQVFQVDLCSVENSVAGSMVRLPGVASQDLWLPTGHVTLMLDKLFKLSGL